MFFLFSWKSAPSHHTTLEGGEGGRHRAGQLSPRHQPACRPPAPMPFVRGVAKAPQGQPHLPAPALPRRGLTLRRGAASRRRGDSPSNRRDPGPTPEPESSPRKGAGTRPRRATPDLEGPPPELGLDESVRLHPPSLRASRLQPSEVRPLGPAVTFRRTPVASLGRCAGLPRPGPRRRQSRSQDRRERRPPRSVRPPVPQPPACPPASPPAPS